MKTKEVFVFRASILALSIITAIVTFTVASQLYVFSKELLLAILGILASASGILLLLSYYKATLETNFKLGELDRYKSRQTHPLYYYRIVKDISILNADGKGRVDYHMECKNTSPKKLPQIKHEINYDGELENFVAYVNKKAFDQKVKKRLFYRHELKDDKKVSAKQPYNLKIWFDVKSERIAPKEDFEYDYSFTCDKLYPDMDKKDIEFTGVHINNPTDILVIRLELPKNLQFVKEDMSIWIVDKHDIRDCFEEEKCLKFHPWFVSRDQRRISWEIVKPKIACTYKLYFRALETRR